MRHLLFSVFFLIPFFLPTNSSAFPWTVDRDILETKKTFYHFTIDSSVTRFLNEDNNRYASRVEVKARQSLSSLSLFQIKMDYTYNWTEDYHYFRPYEANVQLERPDGRWIFGRKRKKWDWADSFWRRGLWQPSYTDDTLRPKWAGLTGIFRHFNYENGQINLFGSFVFIPDFTPPFENKKGKLVSKNPWFVPPPSGKIGSTNIVPVYQFQYPSLTEFLKLSFGGQASYKGTYLSYAYKPMNKIKLKSPITLSLDKEPIGTHEKGYLVDTPLEPVILNHHLVSGGFIIQTEESTSDVKGNTNYFLKTSITYNHPEKHEPSAAKWIFFQPHKEWYLSALGEMQIKDKEEETTVHIGYTHRIQRKGEEDTQSKVLPDIKKEIFREDLFSFSRAVSAGLIHRINFNKSYSAQFKTRVIYHLLHEYFLVSFYGAFLFEKAFSIFVSGDILFSHFPFTIEQTKQDIDIYSNKSRVFGGIRYAF